MTSKPLVLFLGNSLFFDDKIGLVLGGMLRGELESQGYDVMIIEKTGLALADYMEGREEVVIVDSIKTGRHRVGEVVSMSPEDFQLQAPFSPHYVGLSETLALMKQLDLNPPRRVRILAIEVEDPYTISEKMSEKLAGMLNELAEDVRRRLSRTVTSTNGAGL